MQPTYMRSVSFWGKFTSGSRISASRSDLLQLSITFERLPHSKHALFQMYGWIEKDWALLNILAPNSYSFGRKNPCKIGSAFQMSTILRYLQAFSVLEITLALVCLVEAMPTDEKDERNAGNSNGGNNRHKDYYTSFQAHINK